MPGLIAVLFFIMVVLIQVRINPNLAPLTEPMSREQKHTAYIRLIPVIATFGTIIFGLGLGFFMESMAMILIVIPFIWPVLVSINGTDNVMAANSAFGMNTDDLKIWFGILALIVVELGLITPPMRLNVFIISKLTPDVPMLETFKGVFFFVVSEILRIALLLACSAIVFFIPKMLS